MSPETKKQCIDNTYFADLSIHVVRDAYVSVRGNRDFDTVVRTSLVTKSPLLKLIIETIHRFSTPKEKKDNETSIARDTTIKGTSKVGDGFFRLRMVNRAISIGVRAPGKKKPGPRLYYRKNLTIGIVLSIRFSIKVSSFIGYKRSEKAKHRGTNSRQFFGFLRARAREREGERERENRKTRENRRTLNYLAPERVAK